MLRFALVTGFEPFGGETVNPSAVIAGRLDGCEVSPGVRVRAAVVPVTWEGAQPAVIKEIEALGTQAPVILMLGQAGGNPAVAVERVAVNIANGKDNTGLERAEEPIVPGGPPSYFSTLPLRNMVKAVNEAGLPTYISNSAGTYLCNNLFYGVLHYLSTAWDTQGPSPLAGFIHLPYIPKQAVGKNPVPPSMALADIETAVRAALEACLRDCVKQNTPG